jgi:hypothetical protein
MEGKELHDDDDNLKSGPGRKPDRESDDFGLPDASSSSDDDHKYEDRKASEETSFTYSSETEPEDEPTGFGDFEEHTPTYRYTPEEGRKKSPTGLIVFLSILGALILMVVIYWFFIRTPERPRQMQPEISQETEPVEEPVVEEPVREAEPVPFEEEPDQPETGSFETINTGTGRYYIVLNSFVDEDLAEDYARQLSGQGLSTYIISPQGGRGFNRVVIDRDFGTWNEAENMLNEMKGTFGADIWVLKN